MGWSSVLHKNNPTYNFLFEGFWKHVLFKYFLGYSGFKTRPSFWMNLYATDIGFIRPKAKIFTAVDIQLLVS